jgi:hypothetical protein
MMFQNFPRTFENKLSPSRRKKEALPMNYYALTDSDWPWDDEAEGRAVIVLASTPEDAIGIATRKHLAQSPGAGGVTWIVAQLHDVGVGDASWGEDNRPGYGVFSPFGQKAEGDIPGEHQEVLDAIAAHNSGEDE